MENQSIVLNNPYIINFFLQQTALNTCIVCLVVDAMWRNVLKFLVNIKTIQNVSASADFQFLFPLNFRPNEDEHAYCFSHVSVWPLCGATF